MLSDTVKKWADDFQKIIDQNPMDMLGRQYPDSFTNEEQEQTHE